MKPSVKKVIVSVGALVALVLVTCGLTGCNWFGNDDKGSNSSVSQNSGTPAPEIPGLPPDPGEAGKATLAGIDFDNDGVRDDIQRYIAMTYPNSAKTRAALTQYAKVVQNAILDANDKQKSVQHGQEVSEASECLTYVLGSVIPSRQAKTALRPIILNTDARTKVYLTYNDQLGGEVFPGTPDSQIASTCKFDLSTLPN